MVMVAGGGDVMSVVDRVGGGGRMAMACGGVGDNINMVSGMY